MANNRRLENKPPTNIPLSVLLLWIFGGTAFGLIVYLFTPYTHNLDDIKVTLQYVLGPMVWGFFAVALWCGHIRRIDPLVTLSVFAFVLVMLASTVIAPAFPWRAWRDLGYQLTIMSPFIVVVGTCTTKKRFLNLCLFFFLIGCGTVLFGLFHYLGGMGGLLRVIYKDGLPPPGGVSPLYTLLHTLRQNGDMLSTILNRDFYPAYLLMIVPLGIAMALYYRNIFAKIFFILMFFLMCLCIMLAFSKDTYLALFLMVSLFLYMYAIRRNWRAVPKRVWWIWIFGGGFVFLTVLFCVREKFYGLAWENYISIESRKVIWGGAIGIFFDLSRPFAEFIKYIFLGGGGGAFYLMFPVYRAPDYHLYEISNVTLFAHNQYLGLLSEEGLLGLGSFLVFLFIVSRLILREAWRKIEHPLNVYQIALATSVLGISFQNIFSPNIRWTVCGFNYWFLLGLVVAASHLTFSKERLERIHRFYDFSPQLRRGIAVAFLTFALVFQAVSIPYGLTRFNAAKNNNDGLIILNEFTRLCELVRQYPNNKELRNEARRVGLGTIARFRRALAWQPSFITSHYKLAHVYSLMAAPVEEDPATTEPVRDAKMMAWWEIAEKTYNELAYYAPDYSEIHLNYGILSGAFYNKSHDPKHLATSLEEFSRAVEMSEKLNVQLLYLQRLRDGAQAAVTLGANNAETLRLLADTLGKITVAGAKPETVEAGLLQCRELIRAGDSAKAAPLLADLYLEMSVTVAGRIPSLGNIEKGGDEIVDDSRRVVGDYYLRRGRAAEAIASYEALVKEEPDIDPRARSAVLDRFIMACVHAREYKRCLEVLQELTDRNPLDWAPREAARAVFEQIGDFPRALKQAEAVLKIVQEWHKKPEISDPVRGPGVRIQLGRLPSLAEAHYNVGYAAEKCEQDERAFNTYNIVIELDPNGEWGKKALRGQLRIEQKMNEKRDKKTGQDDQATTPPAPSKP